MAGFDNEVVYGTNVDFSGGTPVSAKVTTDGQLLIGSTATPNIRVAVPTGSSGVVITAGSGTLDIGTPNAVQSASIPAVDGDIAVYSGTTGKLIRDSNVNISNAAATSGLITINRSANSGTGLVVTNTSGSATGGAYVELKPSTGDAVLNIHALTHFQIGTKQSDSVIYFTSDAGTTYNQIAGTTYLTLERTSPLNDGQGRFKTFGGRVYFRKATAVNYIMNNADHYVGVTDTSVARTIQLPAVASLVTGQVFIIKDESGGADTNNITVQPSDVVNIDGSSTYVIRTNYGAVQIIYNGTQFYTYPLSSGGGGSGGLEWFDQGGSFSAGVGDGYFCTAALTATLPASPSEGDTIGIVCDTASAVVVTANTGQRIRVGSVLSSAAGTATNTARGDTLNLVYRSSGTTWFSTATTGNWTIT